MRPSPRRGVFGAGRPARVRGRRDTIAGAAPGPGAGGASRATRRPVRRGGHDTLAVPRSPGAAGARRAARCRPVRRVVRRRCSCAHRTARCGWLRSAVSPRRRRVDTPTPGSAMADATPPPPRSATALTTAADSGVDAGADLISPAPRHVAPPAPGRWRSSAARHDDDVHAQAHRHGRDEEPRPGPPRARAHDRRHAKAGGGVAGRRFAADHAVEPAMELAPSAAAPSRIARLDAVHQLRDGLRKITLPC